MSTLTHQDKADLNRRARAHGLPDLWPEYVNLEVEILCDPEYEVLLAEGHMNLLGLNIRGAEALRVSRELAQCPPGGVVVLPRDVFSVGAPKHRSAWRRFMEAFS